MTDKPLVSVIIPTYNRATLLPRALDSALAQTYPNVQIIVVDDGSTDNTAEVMKAYPGVLYVKRLNGGQAAARSTGLEHAAGVYIASLDSDDIWEPLFLERCIDAMETHQLDFVFANWHQQWGDGRISDYFSEFVFLQPYLKGKGESLVLLSYPELRSLYIDCCPSPSSAVVVRRSSFVSAWNDKMHIADDWCLLLDIVLSKEARAGMIQDKLWHKFINADNIYDGRNYYEVLQLMYVEDTYEMLRRMKHRLTTAELRVAQARIVTNTLKMARYTMATRKYVGESCRKVMRALWLNPGMFFRYGWDKIK